MNEENLQLEEAPAPTTDDQQPIDSKQVDAALNTQVEPAIQFESGNFESIDTLAERIATKSTAISKTIIPLIYAALIELLGNSQAFTATMFQANFDETSGSFNVETQFDVPLWIGLDIPTNAIQKDSTYVLERVSAVKDAKFTKCEIDCKEGTLKVNFTI